MAGEKNIENAEPVSTVLESEVMPKLAEQDVVVASAKDGVPSDSLSTISLSDATCDTKGESPQGLDGEQGANPPTSCYNYYYPGYSGSFAQPQLDDNGYFKADGSHADMQSENGQLVYYLPGYSPYANGTLMGVDGQNVGQQPYFSSGYLHPPVSYASDAYSWDSTFVGDVSNGNLDGYGSGKYSAGSTTYAKSNGYNSLKTNCNLGGKFSRPAYTQSIKPTSKVPYFVSDQAAGSFKGYPSAGRYSSYNNQKAGVYPRTSPMNYRSNGKHWNQNDGYKSSNTDFENSAELTRGPRAYKKTAPVDSFTKSEELGLAVRKDQYNLPDFQTEYENAKFFVIKSYSEDDIHKCIKYDVWSSTPNGNKKLNAAYNHVEAKESENGAKCPIFLFFSVNGSGQFVGLAEMVGQVDFNKDMDFWRLDKWPGFFPVKWHIVKDIPNNELRHIILENNDNRPITFSRDTQEIGLKQGLEMLKIFSSHTAKTSLLDDFSFYEQRQKSLSNKKTADAMPLINLTKNLSLNGGS